MVLQCDSICLRRKLGVVIVNEIVLEGAVAVAVQSKSPKRDTPDPGP